MKPEAESDLGFARRVLESEAEAVRNVANRLGNQFEKAIQMILACQGRVVLTGMGKMGLVARKLSATLASTGTPSLFLHPAEAYHGDLGQVVSKDLVLALSYSGQTEEVLRLLPQLKKLGVPVIAVCSNEHSPLASHSDVVLELGEISEACPMGLAPSASTTAMLALGDALAFAVLRHRPFDREQFAFYHPGGSLGRKLLKVKEVMRKGEQLPVVACSDTVHAALISLTSIKRRSGATCVTNPDGTLAGIFTDADLRRRLEEGSDVLSSPVEKIITCRPKTIGPERLASEALHLMRTYKIDELPVVDEGERPLGLVDIQDLAAVGFL